MKNNQASKTNRLISTRAIKRMLCVGSLLLIVPTVNAFDWGGLLKGAMDSTSATASGENPGDSGVEALSVGEISSGLKEALDMGVDVAISLLGQTNGFMGNDKVRIELPEYADMAAQGLRAMGQGQYVDDFELTMNRAAEQAVTEVKDIFVEAISAMTIADAQQILQGPDDAATEYFRRVSGDSLRTRIKPVVAEATDRTGVTMAYKNMLSRADMFGGFVDPGSLDLDNYVTEKTLDGLFYMIAQEEKKIRENPLARSTDLLQKVFGAVQN